MIITNEQLSTLDNSQNSNFLREVHSFLKTEMEEIYNEVPADECELLIVNLQKKAAKYGITELVPFIQYVCMAFIAGKDFDSIPEINALLTEDCLDQSEKMQALVDEASQIEL